MAAKPKSSVLREAFKQDLARCWEHARAIHSKESPYAYVLHGLEGTPELYPYVLTEEGLTRVAKRYVTDGHFETVPEARQELRYSVEDSPYAGELESKLPTVDRLMEPCGNELDETEGYALLAKAAIEAFKALDKQGLFGKGRQRKKLLLMIDTNLAEKDWSLPSVKALNPSAVARRYERETVEERPYATSDDLCFSRDGKTLFYRGYREIDPRKDKSYAEFVACEVAGLKLKRRWSLRFSSFGTGTHALQCASDNTVVFLRGQAEEDGEKLHAVLVRFSRGGKAGYKQIELPTEVTSGAITFDGTLIAVGTHDRKLQFFDRNLKAIKTQPVKMALSRLRFLKSGDLLGISGRKLVRLTRDLRAAPLPYRGEAFRFSLDAEEKSCAISQFPKGNRMIYESRPKDQFGFQLFSFPQMKLLRTVLIPSHKLTWTTLSPDGKYVASVAQECGKYAEFIVIHETKTGREIARRKVSSIDDLAFVPGKPVLALAASTHTHFEPIILWPFQPRR